jgi:hypothetical protein
MNSMNRVLDNTTLKVYSFKEDFDFQMTYYITMEGPGGSMSYVVGLPNNSYKPNTNTAWVRVRLCKLQKRVHSTRSRK